MTRSIRRDVSGLALHMQPESACEAYWLELLQQVSDPTVRRERYAMFCQVHAVLSAQGKIPPSAKNWDQIIQQVLAVMQVVEAAEPPPVTCNTGVITRHNTKQQNEVGRETGGLDTVHVSFYGEWCPDIWNGLTKRFDELLHVSREQGMESARLETPHGRPFAFHPAGRRTGSLFYSWGAHWEGCDVHILNRQQFSQDTPLILVQFKSYPLMQYGLEWLIARLEEDLKVHGFTLRSHIISRVDACVDLPEVNVSEVSRLAIAGHEVTRMRKFGLYGGRTIDEHETWERGNRKRVLFRAYDKLLESKRDLVKQELLVRKRWGGVLPAAATRAEFQFARPVLKDFLIRTSEDLFLQLPQLMEWATSKVYRLAERPVDRENNNQTRVPNAPIWKAIRKAFAGWIGITTQPIKISRSVVKPKAERLQKQALGCLQSMYATVGESFKDTKELLERMIKDTEPWACAMNLGIDRKREEFEKNYLNLLQSPSLDVG